MIPSKINPLGIDRNYPVMGFEKDGNVYDISTASWFNGYIDAEGPIYDSAVARTDINYLTVSPNMTYTIKTFDYKVDGTTPATIGRIAQYNSSFVKIAVTTIGASSGSFTTLADTKYIRWGVNIDKIPTQIVIKVGAITEYEAYNPYTFCVYGESSQEGTPSPEYPSPIISNYPKGVYKTPWGYIRLYDDLRGIGEYRDKITVDVGTGEKILTKKIRHYLPLASYSIEFVAPYQFCPYISGVNLSLLASDNILNMSNKYPAYTRNSISTITPAISTSYEYIRINDNRFTTVTDFKAELTAQFNAGTPVIVDYVLATPITEYL